MNNWWKLSLDDSFSNYITFALEEPGTLLRTELEFEEQVESADREGFPDEGNRPNSTYSSK